MPVTVSASFAGRCSATILRRRQRALELERLAFGDEAAAAGERLVHGGERELRVEAVEAAPGAIALVVVAHGAVGDADVVDRQRGDLARLAAAAGLMIKSAEPPVPETPARTAPASRRRPCPSSCGPSASTRSENTGSFSSRRSTTISWRSSGSSRTPTSKFAAFTSGSPPMLGGADSDTSLRRRPSEGKMVNEAPPPMVRSRPVSAFTRAMISRRM